MMLLLCNGIGQPLKNNIFFLTAASHIATAIDRTSIIVRGRADIECDCRIVIVGFSGDGRFDIVLCGLSRRSPCDVHDVRGHVRMGRCPKPRDFLRHGPRALDRSDALASAEGPRALLCKRKRGLKRYPVSLRYIA
jgi:hypothetical protein